MLYISGIGSGKLNQLCAATSQHINQSAYSSSLSQGIQLPVYGGFNIFWNRIKLHNRQQHQFHHHDSAQAAALATAVPFLTVTLNVRTPAYIHKKNLQSLLQVVVLTNAAHAACAPAGGSYLRGICDKPGGRSRRRIARSLQECSQVKLFYMSARCVPLTSAAARRA